MRAKKQWGQHFLADRSVGYRMVRSVGLSADDVVLEIGPGRGALTGVLLEYARRVIALDIDSHLVDELSRRFPTDSLTLINADILTTDIGELLDRHGLTERVRVFGNLPYNIATAVIQHLLRFRRRIRDATVMLQREVANRLLSPPGNKEYGYLSLVVQYFCEATKLFTVAPDAFRPVPKVHSTVVHLKMRDRPAVSVEDEGYFFEVISACFSERRKTILNNLKRAASRLRLGSEIEAALATAGIEASRRAETLSLEEFARLAHALATSGPPADSPVHR